MLRHLILALAAVTLVTALTPGGAFAHHRGHSHRVAWFNYDLSIPDPRAGRQGFPGGHYRHDCYRAASGRAICPLLSHSL